MSESATKRTRGLLQQRVELSPLEIELINRYQGDFPITAKPFELIAAELGVTSDEIQRTITSLLDRGVITRFGPLYNIERAEGAFSLCALKVSEQRFDEVTELVNSFQEVAHNYQREHIWNMWFVLACNSVEELNETFAEIVKVTDCEGMNMPKLKEFFVGLTLVAD